MLVIARKRGETIRIGKEINVIVLRFVPNRVLLGIEAPRSTPIVRSELPQRVVGSSREERLEIALRNLYDDVAAGQLDSSSMESAGELLEELGIAS